MYSRVWNGTTESQCGLSIRERYFFCFVLFCFLLPFHGHRAGQMYMERFPIIFIYLLFIFLLGLVLVFKKRTLFLRGSLLEAVNNRHSKSFLGSWLKEREKKKKARERKQREKGKK
jgi:hypothetical protein